MRITKPTTLIRAVASTKVGAERAGRKAYAKPDLRRGPMLAAITAVVPKGSVTVV